MLLRTISEIELKLDENKVELLASGHSERDKTDDESILY